MPASEEEFIKRLRATFQVEAEEHLHAISSLLLELEKTPAGAQRAASLENVYREAHSLKGASRAVDLTEIEAICQALETTFSAWKRLDAVPPPKAFDILHEALDSIRAFLTTPSPGAAPPTARPAREQLVQRVLGLQSPPSATPPPPPPSTVAPTPPEPSAAATQSPPASTPAPAPPQPQPPRQPSSEADKPLNSGTVRIPIAKLDARLLQAEDLLSLKSMTAHRAAGLRELTALLADWRKQWAAVSPNVRALRRARESHPPHAAPHDSVPFLASEPLADFLDWNADFFRSLEGKLATLAAQTEQDRHGVAKRVDDLLEESKKLLMLPFSTLAAVLPKMVRDLCRDQGKQADLVIRGADVEIDNRILEEMKDGLIHILRNCVDHGVETPAQRAQLNKPPRASITIDVTRVNGSKVEIAVSDDGAGVDLDRVKDSAVRHGLVSGTDATALPEAEALALIFHSEISTSPIVTAISGRGLGMAIVQAKAEKLGGRVSIDSRKNAGTTIRILLPVTMATFRGILLSSADRTFVVPTANVERVIRIKAAEIQTAENRETLSFQGRVISLARLDRVLDLPAKPRHTDAAAFLSVAVLTAAGLRMAFVVDEVLREEEVLVKPLGKPLVRVRNIAGATVLATGNVVPILNVADLMKSARSKGSPPSAAPIVGAAARPASKHVLVVEDSITSRMLLKGILESAGYQVKVAVDGMEGFTLLRENRFDAVVSDVEMPRLNGFDLTARIRADKRLAELPVILVTALESRDERERGIDVGADAYIIKSSFDQSTLLEVIRRLI